jgi:predicted nucleic acid-binding protein
MTGLFVDTWFLIAYTHRRDRDHALADRMWRRLDHHSRIITHDGVLTEFLAFFAGSGPMVRLKAAQLVRSLPIHGFEVVPQDRALFLRALALYEERLDKGYSLTDCMSMVLMLERDIQHVLTNDHHFRQEGFTVVNQ